MFQSRSLLAGYVPWWKCLFIVLSALCCPLSLFPSTVCFKSLSRTNHRGESVGFFGFCQPLRSGTVCKQDWSSLFLVCSLRRPAASLLSLSSVSYAFLQFVSGLFSVCVYVCVCLFVCVLYMLVAMSVFAYIQGRPLKSCLCNYAGVLSQQGERWND